MTIRPSCPALVTTVELSGDGVTTAPGHQRAARRAAAGINAECRQDRAHAVIGDRSFGSDPEMVAQLGRAACEGLLAGGVALVSALLAGWLAARLLAWRRAAPVRRRAGAVVMDAALIGLLAARLGFIIAWWPEYAAAPWSVLAIGDGGFIGWLGLAVAMAFAFPPPRQDEAKGPGELQPA